MKFASNALASTAFAAATLPIFTSAQQNLVKMCLFYDNPSGHARSDPIINQQCTSSHVHTFYGPQAFHPSTTYQDLLSTPSSLNTSPFVENKSLYWHPAIVSRACAAGSRVLCVSSAVLYLKRLFKSLLYALYSIELLRMERIIELMILNLALTIDGTGVFPPESSHSLLDSV